MAAPLARTEEVVGRFGPAGPPALDGVTMQIPASRITGLVGPDGAGKTTLLRLLAGLLAPSAGRVETLGLDPVREARALHRRIAYMPQRFGLYEDLTVGENLDLYADLRDAAGEARTSDIARLLAFTGLEPFRARLAERLSGGMKQKLGLACALLGRPELLLLDEPSVGVDPISRRELWEMVEALTREGVGVVWSTAYLDEAERCGQVALLSEGRLLHQGPPEALTAKMRGRSFRLRGAGADRRRILARALADPRVIDGALEGAALRLVTAEGTAPPAPEALGAAPEARLLPAPPRFEDAFIDLLGGGPAAASPFAELFGTREAGPEPAIEAQGLTRRFGGFTAARDVTFSVARGEVFGLIGPNGAGKSTTFRMLCGLLRPSEGRARVAGVDLAAAPSRARARIGYMAQRFSLYGDLSVAQNLAFFARVYGLGRAARREAIDRLTEIFALGPRLSENAGALPPGHRQRLALACAVMHGPDVLFLDEPTSGVDPRTRREFWTHINAMVSAGVTVMVTTHFLDEAEHCDRLALIHRGRIIARGAPDALRAQAAAADGPEPTLEDAFVALVEADADAETAA